LRYYVQNDLHYDVTKHARCLAVALVVFFDDRLSGAQRIAQCGARTSGQHVSSGSRQLRTSWGKNRYWRWQIEITFICRNTRWKYFISAIHRVFVQLHTVSETSLFKLFIYRMAPKSKPLSRIIIISYYNPPLRLHFLSVSTTKWAQAYNKSVLNILCVT